ncbi:hypothetical protein [Dokdonella sp.]|uniref:hypothetical protein n=1 Tax=Dokdonella sp. TaxID=2291710 RepID=UPI003784AF6C
MDAQGADEGGGGIERDFDAARTAFDQAMRVAQAALALLRAELSLARSSALLLVWLSFLLVFLGVGAWLAASAAIAVGVYQLSGNLFLGIGSVALANVIGGVAVLFAMRGCWRELTLPRTRRVLAGITEARA